MQGPHERTTTDRLGRHTLVQPKAGFRFSIESVLLAAFATPPPPIRRGCGPVPQAIADLCAGCGILGVLLAARGAPGPFLAVEIDPLAAQCCAENYALAGMDGQVLCHDLTADHPDMKPGGFGLVICNPPFTRQGQGRTSPDPARAKARHELALEADALWQRASRLLARSGRLAVCWPGDRLPEALEGMGRHRLTPKRLRVVHGRADLPGKVVHIEAVKDGGSQLEILPPLIVHSSGQEYGEEVKAIYRDLCGL